MATMRCGTGCCGGPVGILEIGHLTLRYSDDCQRSSEYVESLPAVEISAGKAFDIITLNPDCWNEFQWFFDGRPISQEEAEARVLEVEELWL